MTSRQKKLAAILKRIPGNSSSDQRDRLLAAMLRTGSVTSYEAMRILDVFDPRPRIFELSAQCYEITTVTRLQETEAGVPHRIGVYVLPAREVAA